jgi:hypothetical protein
MSATNDGTDAPDRNGGTATWLIELYMKANQGIYAVVALPIGTVLSITPIFLSLQQNVPLALIGGLMALGEFFGIFAMLYAEKSEHGFIFRRPNDLILISALLAFSLFFIPFTGNLGYVSAVFMMSVQFFNSASKPVMGESLHRLAVLTEKDSSMVFAQANFYRRVGNLVMAFVMPVLYAYVNFLPFVLIGGVILLFLISCYAMETKIKSICMNDLNSHYPAIERRLAIRMTSEHISLPQNFSELDSQPPTSPYISDHIKSSTPTRRPGKRRNTRTSTISMLSNYSKRQDERLERYERDGSGSNSINSFNKIPMSTSVDIHFDLEDNSMIAKENFHQVSFRADDFNDVESICKSAALSQSIKKEDDEEDDEKDDEKDDEEDEKTREKTVHDALRLEEGRDDNEETITFEKESNLSYFLIVWIFPFWDALISRLPFSFLMICIVDPKYDELNCFGNFVDEELNELNGFAEKEKMMIIYAGFILCAYQFGRAIAQQIQVRRCDTTINYVLNVIALLAYFAFAMIAQFSDTRLWFVPIVFTGFAETLPIQQLYLVGLFGDGDGDEREMSIRHAVQTSHTFTGAGSCLAFLVGSQIYNSFRIQGIAYLGLAIMVLKLATNLIIDYLHNQKEKKMKKDFRKRRESYSNLFESQHVVVP